MALPFISVIMPVYNAMPRLTAAAGSVLAQSCDDIELILVDDASTDGSLAECRRIAAGDSRALVLALGQNGGLANARNKGFEACRGAYVHFMDADDAIDRDLYARCRAALEETPADWVAWGVTEEHYDAEGHIRSVRQVETVGGFFTDPGGMRMMYLEMEKRTLFGYAWNKLYRRGLIKERGLAFPNIKLVEDALFNIKYAKAARSLLLLSGAPYHYARNAGASLTSGHIADYFDLNEKRLDGMLALYRGWGMDGRETRAALAGIYVRYLYSALARNCDPRAGLSQKGRREWLRGRFGSPLYAALMPFAAPDNKLTHLMARWAGRKRASVCLAAGRAIYLTRRLLPALFDRASRNR